ncbi:universal stress protein [Halorubellus sp. JP-L1]|uniref:universal stress protein n=1 Tax=Halorubellus sp. JP-L1 TaxID=2715753 RepID=UPI001409CFD6|nr:universal stress protein [Halorubellus sp. JP-L1]NHN43260.1 universal stress protein [Halorubellus sp. JP-L1]
MTFVVPFDGSSQSEWGIRRAVELAPGPVRVVAFSVVPRKHATWARERDLLGPAEAFETERVLSRLEERAHAVHDDVVFQHTTVDRYAPTGKIAHEIRSFARNGDARMVFVGSREAGGVVSSLQSVGEHVASDDAYDVVLVRRSDSVLD